MSTTNHHLNEYDLASSRVLSQGFEIREIRLADKRARPIRVNFRKMSPGEIEAELQRGLEIGCNKSKVESIKADYHVWNLINEQMRGKAMVVVADAIQEISQQEDGSLLSENDLAQIDYALAKCEKKEDIAVRFGTSVDVISTRELREHQAIIDLRRRLNAELEDSTIGLAHDFVRLEELQETLEIVKAHITEYEALRVRVDMSPEDKLHRMGAIPNIISLLNTKEKIISSASKEMRTRKEAAAASGNVFDLTESEQELFEKLHQKLPIMELVVARASTDNGWDPAYMLSKLNKSIYRDFRRGLVGEEKEIKKLKDMTLPYPSNEPVDLENIIKETSGRDEDRNLMADRDRGVSGEKISEIDKKKQELLDKIKKKKEDANNRGNEKA